MSLQQQARIETFVDNRKRRRHKLCLEVEARGPEALDGFVIVLDISDTGLLIESEAPLKAGEMIEVFLPHTGPVVAEIMWEGGDIYGCRFTQELTPAAISAARLGGRFSLPKTNGASETAIGSPQGPTQSTMAMSNELSLGARVSIIVGLALSLWLAIGMATYWALA